VGPSISLRKKGEGILTFGQVGLNCLGSRETALASRTVVQKDQEVLVLKKIHDKEKKLVRDRRSSGRRLPKEGERPGDHAAGKGKRPPKTDRAWRKNRQHRRRKKARA